MNILNEIIQNKKLEVEEQKKNVSIKQLENSEYFSRRTISLKNILLKQTSSGIIAEFKRKSPSKGIINNNAIVETVTTGYAKAGASCLSVLTDNKYFGGSNEDLLKARKVNNLPVLRKEFMVDEYQIIEAKSIGADVILLIAACLPIEEIDRFSKFAKSLNLEILLELHDESELEKISPDVDFVGINNRNLKNFHVDIEQSIKLASRIPANFVKIAESGINSPDEVKRFRNEGFKGFLMGERFMKTNSPEKACEEFIKQLK